MSTPGPSRARLSDYRPPRSLSSRPTTPAPHVYNSHGFITTPAFANDASLRSQWHESVNRLQKVWDDLILRYERVEIDADEIDITTGKVISDRGHLSGMERRDFYLQGEGEGFGVEGEEEGEVEEEREFDSDEDELSVWDERSRLETQGLESDDEKVEGPWTQEDEDDMQAFLRAEGRRKDVMGDEKEEEVDVMDFASAGRGKPEMGNDKRPSLEDLFTDDDECKEWSDDSDDELLAQTSEAEEATRVTLLSSPSQGYLKAQSVCCSTTSTQRADGSYSVLTRAHLLRKIPLRL
jgi:hypothetical protein